MQSYAGHVQVCSAYKSVLLTGCMTKADPDAKWATSSAPCSLNPDAQRHCEEHSATMTETVEDKARGIGARCKGYTQGARATCKVQGVQGQDVRAIRKLGWSSTHGNGLSRCPALN